MEAAPGVSATGFRGPWIGVSLIPRCSWHLTLESLWRPRASMILPIGGGIRTLPRRPRDMLFLLIITLTQIIVPE